MGGGAMIKLLHPFINPSTFNKERAY